MYELHACKAFVLACLPVVLTGCGGLQAPNKSPGEPDAEDQCGPQFPDRLSYYTDPMLEPQNASMRPGEVRTFNVVRWVCCYELLTATSTPCVEWTISPQDAGTIAEDGTLELAETLTDGEQFTVRASFPEPDPLVLETTVTVYTPERNPLVGQWIGRYAISCEDRTETFPEHTFGELIFRASGEFDFTWAPFELYVNYWGTYTYDAETSELSMEITDGNSIPEETDLQGTIDVQGDGTIILNDVYFGDWPGNDVEERTCGYLIARVAEPPCGWRCGKRVPRASSE